MSKTAKKERGCLGGEHVWRPPRHTHPASAGYDGSTITTDWCAACGLTRVRRWKDRSLASERYEEHLPDWSALAERAPRSREAWDLLYDHACACLEAAAAMLRVVRDRASEVRRYERNGLVHAVDTVVDNDHTRDALGSGLVKAAYEAAEAADAAHAA